MKKRKKKRSLKPVIALLLIALAAVGALIIWKQTEYRAGEAFYEGLRGMEQMWRRSV